MNIKHFTKALATVGIDYYAGVPDSQLKCLCDELYAEKTLGKDHVIAHNEGGAVALCAGYHLATGKVGCVYMQNSGIGNAVNPICSLLNPKVYAIPVLFVVGYRGEPGVHDEPQHVFQGEVTVAQLEQLGIRAVVLDGQTTLSDVNERLAEFVKAFQKGDSCAFVIKKGTFESELKPLYQNQYRMKREDAIESIVSQLEKDDLIVSTTGKASRELFEIRERAGTGHAQDFLTVGSMGHSSMIALGLDKNTTRGRVWCLDGDGALIMHMGALATAAHYADNRYRYILINNGSHETVGGLPTLSPFIDYRKLAEAVGFDTYFVAETKEELSQAVSKMKDAKGKCFLEVRTDLSSRKDLGRPTTTPVENKTALMQAVRERLK